VVFRIVEGMKGKLEIEREVGKGTNGEIFFTENDSVLLRFYYYSIKQDSI